jgi:multiple sugar transport system permease protein
MNSPIRRFFQSRTAFEPSPFRKVISYILLGAWTFVALFPFYWLFTTGFKTRDAIDGTPRYLPFIDFTPTLAAWERVLGQTELQVFRPYFNTLLTATISALLALVIGATASYALSRYQYRVRPGLIGAFAACVAGMVLLIALGLAWPAALGVMLGVYIILAWAILKYRRPRGTIGNNDIAFWLVSQRMLPPIAVILPIYVMYQQLRLLNTLPGLIIIYTATNLPLVIWFMRDYFQSLPIELEECAFIDGANRYQTLLRVVLPLAIPGLVATFLIVLVFAWNEYTVALFLTGGDTQTMPLLVAGQNATRGPQWDNISVLVTLMVAPIVAIAIILERFIVRGLLVGAVKG